MRYIIRNFRITATSRATFDLGLGLNKLPALSRAIVNAKQKIYSSLINPISSQVVNSPDLTTTPIFQLFLNRAWYTCLNTQDHRTWNDPLILSKLSSDTQLNRSINYDVSERGERKLLQST